MTPPSTDPISGLPAASAALADGDLLPYVDISDLTEAATGTTKKATVAQVRAAILGPIAVDALLATVAIAGRLGVAAGALAENALALSVTGTLFASAADQYGIYFNMTGAGAAAGEQYAARFELNSGYTGTSSTFVVRGVNNSAGVGSGTGHANVGIEGVSHGAGFDTLGTYNTGAKGQARWGSVWNVGVHGLAVNTNGVTQRVGQASVGVYGQGQSDLTGYQIGGYFTLGNTDPTCLLRAALVADNQVAADPVALFRANGVTWFQIDATGVAIFDRTLKAQLGIAITPGYGLTDGSAEWLSYLGSSGYATLSAVSGLKIAGNSLWIAGGKVVGAQAAAIASATDAASAITQLNLWLAAARTHGLIAT